MESSAVILFICQTNCSTMAETIDSWVKMSRLYRRAIQLGGQDNNRIIGTEEILLPTATTAGVPPNFPTIPAEGICSVQPNSKTGGDILSQLRHIVTGSEGAGGRLRQVIKSVLYSWHVSAHLNKIISHPLLIFLSHAEKFGNI